MSHSQLGIPEHSYKAIFVLHGFSVPWLIQRTQPADYCKCS